jgi:hypothetical protein
MWQDNIISEDLAASIFSLNIEAATDVPSNRWHPTTSAHGVTTQMVTSWVYIDYTENK